MAGFLFPPHLANPIFTAFDRTYQTCGKNFRFGLAAASQPTTFSLFLDAHNPLNQMKCTLMRNCGDKAHTDHTKRFTRLILLSKRSPRYLDLPDLKKHMQFIDQKRLGTVSSSQQP
jgi:hypothetical protein